MGNKNLLIVLFLSFIFVASGMLYGQRVIDLDKVWGDMRVLGDDADDESGYSVAYGDINSDGYMDIIIGAHYADPGARSAAGEVYVIFGSSNPPSTIDLDKLSADIIVYGKDADDHCGHAVASGDINGDDYDDVIIGAPNAGPPAGSYSGETYVIFGGSFSSPPYTIDLNTKPADITVYWDLKDVGFDVYLGSGWAVASGNINGDSYDDLIIGAPYAYTPGESGPGWTHVLFGNSFLSPPYTINLHTESNKIEIWGDDVDDYSGYAVASGDVNGDGYEDLIIGAPEADPGGRTEAGETYVIFGSSSPPSYLYIESAADITIYGDDYWDNSGYAVASGNINGDGYNDIIIGAPWAYNGGLGWAGETYVIFGSSSPHSTIDLSIESADITVQGEDEENWSGQAVASGDVNGDGYNDIIIGSTGGTAVSPGGAWAGVSYVIFGSSSPPATIDLMTQSADITVYGDDEGDWLGSVVAGGDVNGDGYDDLLIGAYGADPGGRSKAGETYLISGGGAFITAHGLGGKSWIKEFSLLGRSWGSFKAFGAANSQGEVHLTVGDIEADSLDEIVAGQGEGGKSWVKFFEVDGTFIGTFKAFGAANTNGELHLAIGNFDDFTSDKEIAIAQGEGGQSWVKTFKTDGTLVIVFKAFGAANAQGEVHLASGDLNKDGIDEIIVGMGEGGSSWVKVFNLWGDFIRSFRAFDAIDNPGGEVRLVVGNFDADPAVEIAVATGYNGGNKVRLFDKNGTSIGEFTAFGFGGNTNGDVQIAAADIDNDGIDEIICGHGEGGSSMVKVFKADGTFIRSFKAFGAVNAQGEVHLGKSNY